MRSTRGKPSRVYALRFGEFDAPASKERKQVVLESALKPLRSGKGKVTLGGTDQEVLAVAVRPADGQVVTSGFETAVSWWDPKDED